VEELRGVGEHHSDGEHLRRGGGAPSSTSTSDSDKSSPGKPVCIGGLNFTKEQWLASQVE
jgi:hypothetical protein